MPQTYRSLIYAAVTNATRGVDPATSPAVDAESIAESLFDTVSQSVCEAAAASEYRRSLTMREKSITLVAGAATLTDDVLTKYIADAVLIDPSTLSKHYAWRPYPDFVKRGDRRLGIFSLRGGVDFVVIDPNAPFTVPLTTTGARTLTVPCVIVKPTTADSNIDGDPELLGDLEEGLGEALKGQLAKIAGQAA